MYDFNIKYIKSDIFNECNNPYHGTIKIKPGDAKSGTYIDFDKGNNNEDSKFEIGDHVRVSKYKNIFAKGYVTNWSKEIFVIKKVKNTIPCIYVLEDLNGE